MYGSVKASSLIFPHLYFQPSILSERPRLNCRIGLVVEMLGFTLNSYCSRDSTRSYSS
jgi:hypothetical protein